MPNPTPGQWWRCRARPEVVMEVIGVVGFCEFMLPGSVVVRIVSTGAERSLSVSELLELYELEGE